MLAYGEGLLEQVAEGEERERERAAFPERFEVRMPCLMICQGSGGKMRVVEFALGLVLTGMFRSSNGKVLEFNECVEKIGMVFGEKIENVAQLKRDLLKRKDPAAFLRSMAKSIDNFREEHEG